MGIVNQIKISIRGQKWPGLVEVDLTVNFIMKFLK